MARPRSTSLTGMLEGIEGWLPAEAFRDSDEDATDMLDEALVRGEMAQRRRRLRRRLVSRPRDVLDEPQDTYGHLRELNETSSHNVAGQADVISEDDSSPDPLLRRLSHAPTSIARAESIFFPPSPDRNRQVSASRSSTNNLASRQARRQSSNPQQPRPVTLKPVLLLYCATPPTADSQRPTSKDGLPADFFYLDDAGDRLFQPECPQRNTPSSRKKYSPPTDTISGGGGCGALICARAHTASGLDVFASQTPPPTSTVDWLDPITEADEPSVEGERWRLGLTCGCKRAYLGCRVCGNLVGRAAISTCHRCKRSNNDSQPSQWTFFTSAVICAARKEGQVPASQIPPDLATPLAASSPAGKVMRWELGSVPFLDDDIKCGLAGDIDEWDRRAKTAFEPSLDQLNTPGLGYAGDTVSQATGRNVRPWRYPDPAVDLLANQGLRDPWPSLPVEFQRDSHYSHITNLAEGGSRPRRLASIPPTESSFRFSAAESEQAGIDLDADAALGDSLRRIRGLRQIMRQPTGEAARNWTGPSGPPSAGSGTGANAVELPVIDGEDSDPELLVRSSHRRRRRSSSANVGEAGARMPPSGIREGGRAIRQRVGSRSEGASRQNPVHTSQAGEPVGR